jgi:hypothetical protein
LKTTNEYVRASVGWLTLLRSLIICSLLASSIRALGADQQQAPEKLMVKWGSDLFGWWKLELEGQNVVYTKHHIDNAEERTTNRPQTGDWKVFRKALEELQVWQWQPSYPNPDIIDGAQWSAEIIYPDKTLKVIADNNYPGATGAAVGGPKSTDTFRAFVAAVWKLMGRMKGRLPPTN